MTEEAGEDTPPSEGHGAPAAPLSEGPIGSASIDPSAEPQRSKAAAVSGQQEAEFFNKGKTEFELENNRQNLGSVGSFFGTNSAAPINIAGFVVAISLIGFLIVTFFFADAKGTPDSQKLLIGLISSGMAFIFGASSTKK
jgi:hypothetical protein